MLLPEQLSSTRGLLSLELEREEGRERAVLACLFQPGTDAADDARLRAALSPEEAAVAARYQLPRRRGSYLMGRYCAKAALAPLLGENDLRRIGIHAGVFGQPLVRHRSGAPFGVSLTHWDTGAAAIAFPDGHPMGIDGESPNPDRLHTMSLSLSPEEARWAARSPLLRTTAAWTAREALSKVLRCGLMAPLEFLAIAPPAEADGNRGILEGNYAHFTQYRFVTLFHQQAVLSLCLPRRSRITGVEAIAAVEAQVESSARLESA